MLLAPSVQAVEATLLRAGHPVAQPLPSPVIHADTSSAALLLALPARLSAEPRFEATPADALEIGPCERAGLSTAFRAASRGGAARLRCPIRPRRAPADGRVLVEVSIPRAPSASGAVPLRMTIHLFVAAAADELVAAHGAHGATRAWMPRGTPDPWHRDGAFFGWDDAAHAPVTQERRVYMSGLSDEAGAGAHLAMAAKQASAPRAEEVALLEEFVNAALFQGEHPDRAAFLQSSSDHSVRLSMLYWSDELNDQHSAAGRAATEAAPQLASVCRRCWPKACSWMDCWTKEHSLETWRAYNYPHVTVVYWALYRAARWQSPPLTRRAGWATYLSHAHKTAMALWTHGGDPWTKKAGGGIGTAQWGLMVGSIFELLLTDLRREGWSTEAAELQRTVEQRMAVWLKMPFPYGSEFSWDSTGHEEISTWMLRFGRAAEARQTLDAITAYSSASPHWAYCGAARRWWDFTINGATMRGNERVMHHYAAALNSIPMFDHAMRAPDDDWLWRLAACAGGGTLTNIRRDGSASMGLHGDPDLLVRDAYSADFGVGFYGHWKNAGSYLSCSDALGWLCVGCDLSSVRPAGALALSNRSACDLATELRLAPRDGFRTRLYLQPLGTMLTLDGGRFESALLTLPRGRPAGASAAVLRLVAHPPGSTHAMLTLRADGGAEAAGRRLRMRCSDPCGFEPSPLAGDADEVRYLRFGDRAATLEIDAETLS